jgi:hypothetical protein
MKSADTTIECLQNQLCLFVNKATLFTSAPGGLYKATREQAELICSWNNQPELSTDHAMYEQLSDDYYEVSPQRRRQRLRRRLRGRQRGPDGYLGDDEHEEEPDQEQLQTRFRDAAQVLAGRESELAGVQLWRLRRDFAGWLRDPAVLDVPFQEWTFERLHHYSDNVMHPKLGLIRRMADIVRGVGDCQLHAALHAFYMWIFDLRERAWAHLLPAHFRENHWQPEKEEPSHPQDLLRDMAERLRRQREQRQQQQG